ncbi:hypothetical protein ACIF80_00660 [Streptomyces sp. NPDC085927]|uniref:hypothetical protein n=1 Tax=Streptomyces sp. NPDC085927 TaxID=3365738 RepID=UPI0037CF19B9
MEVGGTMDLLTLLDEAVAALKQPLRQCDIEEGWTDELRRELQEEISVSRSALRRHGQVMVRYLHPNRGSSPSSLDPREIT